MRPNSHHEQTPERRCGTCKHGHVPHYKDHLLCFFGDNVVVRKWKWDTDDSSTKTDVELDGEDVGLMEDGYDEIWAGRVVDDTDICDEYEPE